MSRTPRRGGAPMTPSRTAFAAILAKDLRSELRTLQSLPAMALFAVTTFVIFRFGLDRTQLSGSLAAGVLWATLLFAAVLGINRLFVAEREEGGFDAIRLAPIDRSVLFAAKAAALLVYLLALEASRCRSSPSSSSTTSAACCRWRWSCCSPTSASPSTGTLISSMAVNSRARDLLVPLVLLPLVVPLMIAATGATEPLLARAVLLRPLRHLADGARAIRSDLRPGRLCGVRLPPRGLTGRGRRLSTRDACTAKDCRHTLDRHRGDDRRVAFAGLLLRPARRRPGLHPEDLLPARAAGDRRAGRLHRRRRLRDRPPAHGRPQVGCLLLRLDPHVGDLRRRRADHRRDLGQGLLGPLVGLGRADAGQLPDRLPPVRDLLPLPLRDRGPRAAGPLRLRLRDHRRRLRAAQLHGGADGAEPRPPAHLRDRRRRPARRDDARLPRLPGGDRAALGDPGQVRADREERLRPGQAPAPRARRPRPRRPARGSLRR